MTKKFNNNGNNNDNSKLVWLFRTEQKKNDSGLSKKWKQLANSVEAFKTDQNIKELTEQIIDTTADENLLQVVLTTFLKNTTDFEKEYEIVMSWNKSQQGFIWFGH